MPQLEHILLRPDTYIGSTEKQTQQLWVHDGERMVFKNIGFVPGLYKIFDEILVNASDNKVRDASMDTLRVDIDVVGAAAGDALVGGRAVGPAGVGDAAVAGSTSTGACPVGWRTSRQASNAAQHAITVSPHCCLLHCCCRYCRQSTHHPLAPAPPLPPCRPTRRPRDAARC